jgi:glycosyltransferase involved in cell wall biosynthesis
MSTSAMKKILLIAYYFPPDSAVGGLRIAKFARYLPSYGWEPTVLTIKDRYRKQFDKERANGLNSTRVLKTVKVPAVTNILLSIKRIASVVFRSGKVKDRTDNGNIFEETLGHIKSENYLQKLKRYYLSFRFLPDGERSWVIPATIRTIIEIKQRRFNCIMTSSPPQSSHLIGFIAKSLTHVTWVADFRDPWIELQQQKTPLIRTTLSDKIEQWMEKQVIRNADTIITTTEEHRKAVMARFQAEAEEKFLYIPNGIDTEKYPSKDLAERYDKFTISYAGTFYLKRSPEPIFRAIHKLISTGRLEPSEIKFKLFGNCDLMDGQPISSMIQAYGLDSIVEVSGPVPLSDALLIMQRSHLLLLLVTPIQSINIPAKIYDYFGSGTKIMAITEPGATSDLIKNTNSGTCFFPTDIDGIADHIVTLLRREDRDRLRNDPTYYARFDAKRLSGQLAGRLFSLTGNFSSLLSKE